MSLGITFRGNEPVNTTTNQVQNNPQGTQQPSQVNFRGYNQDVYYSTQPEKKGLGFFGTVAALTCAATLIIGGMGYAHKKVDLSKFKNENVKKLFEKCEPATKKCHDWCVQAKNFGTENWNKLKSFFKK